MTFNIEQKQALDVLNSGVNAFITGGAGVGKTTVLKEFIDKQRNIGKNIMITAPTGIAALGVGGVTMSKAFKIPFGVLTYKIKQLDATDELVNSDIVIIDEISMCRIDTFDFACNRILNANERRKNMGKKSIQLIVVGDFFQLPPVMHSKEKELLDKHYGFDVGLGFAFMSKFWKMFKFYNIMLTIVERQHDREFIENINKIRIGNKAYIEQIVDMSSTSKIDDGIVVCGMNSEVNRINQEELGKIHGMAVKYTAQKTGDATEQDVIADEELVLKVGARVMVLANIPQAVNGSLGVVKGLFNDGVLVELDNGVQLAVAAYTWNVYDYRLQEVDGVEKLEAFVSGTFTQIPLKLAYAITVHKSQGQTYDKVNISPYCWECGQLYVAISRARDIAHVYFNYKPNTSYIVVSLNVIKFYNSLQLGGEMPTASKDEDLDSDMIKILERLGE